MVNLPQIKATGTSISKALGLNNRRNSTDSNSSTSSDVAPNNKRQTTEMIFDENGIGYADETHVILATKANQVEDKESISTVGYMSYG